MREHPCARVEERLSDLVNGELPLEERRQLAIHAAACEHCAQVLGGLYATRVALHTPVPDRVSVPRAFWSRVRGRLDQVDRVIRATEVVPPARPLPRFAQAAIAVALVAIVVAGVLRAGAALRTDDLAQFAQLHMTATATPGDPGKQQTIGFGVHSRWQQVAKRLLDHGGTMVMQTVYDVDGLPVSVFRMPDRSLDVGRLVPVQAGSQTVYLGAQGASSLAAIRGPGAWEIVAARTPPEHLLRLAIMRPNDVPLAPGL